MVQMGMSKALLCAVLASVLVVVVALPLPPPSRLPADFATDIEQQSFPVDPRRAPYLAVRSFNATVKSTGRPYSAFTATLMDPRRFAIELPTTGCAAPRSKTSATAASRGCLYATNGGFFSKTGCEGNLVVNGSDVQLTGDARSNVGLTLDGRIIFGFIALADLTAHRFHFSSLIQGSGWLVRAGKNYASITPDLDPKSGFFTEKAPRTVIASMPDGRLVLYQTDGIESTKVGLGLGELAEVLVDFGVQNAVNIDGGGSSTSWYNGHVIDQPTCVDTPTPICERPVTSITCIRPQA